MCVCVSVGGNIADTGDDVCLTVSLSVCLSMYLSVSLCLWSESQSPLLERIIVGELSGRQLTLRRPTDCEFSLMILRC